VRARHVNVQPEQMVQVRQANERSRHVIVRARQVNVLIRQAIVLDMHAIARARQEIVQGTVG
jgi:hypothetical protein